MGATTFVPTKQSVTNDGRRLVEGNLTMSASYATGGDTVPLVVSVGLSRLQEMEQLSSASKFSAAPSVANTGYQLILAGTETVPLIKAVKSTGVEETAATNLATKVFPVRFIGYA